MTEWRWIFLCVFVPLSIVLIWRKKQAERREIIEFGGDDIQVLKLVQADWLCDRVIKRARPLGWEPIRQDRTDPSQSVLVMRRIGDSSVKLPELLLRLNRASLACHPQRVDMNSDEMAT